MWWARGAFALPLDGCWPKNRDARPIKSRFYQSQNALKLAILSSKTEEKFLGRGKAPFPHPPSAPWYSRIRRSTRLTPSALDLSPRAQAPSFATHSESAPQLNLAVSLPVGHYRHLLLVLRPKADKHLVQFGRVVWADRQISKHTYRQANHSTSHR